MTCSGCLEQNPHSILNEADFASASGLNTTDNTAAHISSDGASVCPTIMAHCVHSTDEEIQMIKDQGVYIAHCPESNTDIASGIAPVRRLS